MIHEYQGSFGPYYTIEDYRGELPCPFDYRFPISWATDEGDLSFGGDKTITGPLICPTCRRLGFLNGVFIGYCYKCAQQYNFQRGKGLTQLQTENGWPHEAEKVWNLRGYELHVPKKYSIYETYLKNFDVNKVGDSAWLQKFNEGFFEDGYHELVHY